LNICGCQKHWTMVTPFYCPDYFVNMDRLVGGIHRKRGRSHPRNLWANRPRHWRCERRCRQHSGSQTHARGHRRQVDSITCSSILLGTHSY
jgi:hypothetical protein